MARPMLRRGVSEEQTINGSHPSVEAVTAATLPVSLKSEEIIAADIRESVNREKRMPEISSLFPMRDLVLEQICILFKSGFPSPSDWLSRSAVKANGFELRRTLKRTQIESNGD